MYKISFKVFWEIWLDVAGKRWVQKKKQKKGKLRHWTTDWKCNYKLEISFM